MTINALDGFQQRQANRWLAIASYLKDRTRVFLLFPDFNDFVQIGYRESDWSEYEPSQWYGSWPTIHFLAHQPKPTHWMPLPETPR